MLFSPRVSIMPESKVISSIYSTQLYSAWVLSWLFLLLKARTICTFHFTSVILFTYRYLGVSFPSVLAFPLSFCTFKHLYGLAPLDQPSFLLSICCSSSDPLLSTCVQSSCTVFLLRSVVVFSLSYRLLKSLPLSLTLFPFFLHPHAPLKHVFKLVDPNLPFFPFTLLFLPP